MKIRTVATAALLAAAFAVAPLPPTTGSAVAAPSASCSAFGPKKGPSVVRYGLDAKELRSRFFDPAHGLAGEGYRPDRIAGYQDGTKVRYATRWVKAGGQWRARFGLTGDELHKEYLAHKATHRIVDVSGYNTPKGIRFALVWERNTAGTGWKVHRDVDRKGMQKLVDAASKHGWVPARVEGYRNGSGDLRYVSVWVKAACSWVMHNRMTRAEYQQHLDEYKGSYRLVHLDSTVEGGTVRFHGIWWKRSAAAQIVRSDAHWYRFQRFFNDNGCAGYALTNLYATDAPGGVRFGGIWTSGSPLTVDATSPLTDRIGKEVDCVPARAGAVLIDLSSGTQVLHHADQSFAPSSTIKSAILYALLRKADADGTNIFKEKLEVQLPYGSNQGNALVDGAEYSLDTLARRMIDQSNNAATNHLIDYVGRDRINDELKALGLKRTRLNRYMIGSGAPSAHGTSGPTADHKAGWDNTTTPREYATFLQKVHENDGLLSPALSARFWSILALNGTDYDGILDGGVGTSWPASLTLALKGGNNTFTGQPGDFAARPQMGSYIERSTAGRMVFADGRVVVFAAFANEGDTGADGQLGNMLGCIVVEAAREFSGTTTGTDLTQCR